MKIVEIVRELGMTFSNRKSLLSSKRIERFVIFSTMLAITLFFLVKNILNCEISAVDFTIVVGLWMGFAGYNTYQIRKDKTDESTGD